MMAVTVVPVGVPTHDAAEKVSPGLGP